jgi:hypothetical protein
LEAWRERLRERIRTGTRAGEKPLVTLSLTGPSRVGSADATGLTAVVGGSASAAVRWSNLKSDDYLRLARAFCRKGSAADHATLAFFLMADGQTVAAEMELARTRGSDPKQGPALVEEVRAAFRAK